MPDTASILLPATDAAAGVELASIAVAAAMLIVMTRHHRELRLLVAGCAVLLIAVVAARALH
ncbi:MAG: hypothetical protein H0W70_03140 [Actinobacteria bacterium]|nr:hypothetical protein [Actinomycetota bacterium]